MERVYFGQIEVSTVDTNFLIESTENLDTLVIEANTTEGTEILDGTFTLTLDSAENYTADDIEMLILGDDDVIAATVEGTPEEEEATAWVGTSDLQEGKEAQWAFGTRLYKQKDNGNYERVLKVVNFGGPSFSVDFEDTTDHDSPGGWEEQLPTILRSGELSLDVSFLPALNNHVKLLEDMKNKKRRKFKLVFPDENRTTWSFMAYVAGWDTDMPHDSKADASVDLNLTGEPDLNNEMPA